MTPSARAAALRSTALATAVALAVGLSALPAGARAKPKKVPLPAPRPIARSVVPKHPPAAHVARGPAAAPLPPSAPATLQRAALPIPNKHVIPAAVAATSSTSQSDKDALRSVIELVRKHKPSDATQVEATISDPVAHKLAEWLILRSDDNGASVERYRAFISANPSWPSQKFLRRRIEAALWDDNRDDATVSSWFANELPISEKGKFALARAMLARGDRANAERLVRDAWRQRRHVGTTPRTTALDLFGALLTAGDHKARMDTLLYGTGAEAGGMRAAKRLGSGQVALAKARIAANKKAYNSSPCSMRCRANCTATPATCSRKSSCCGARRNSPRPHS